MMMVMCYGEGSQVSALHLFRQRAWMNSNSSANAQPLFGLDGKTVSNMSARSYSSEP